MKSENYEETPRGPLSQSAIKRNFFTQISKSEFDKLFTSQTFIGSGAQGEVYSAFFQGEKIAIKYFRKQSLGPDLIYYIQSEIQSLDEIRHRNILSLISTYQVIISNYSKKFCIVTEFCESSLNNFDKIEPLTEIQKIRICSQMMAGINAAHKKKIMHRDVKPDNILIKDLNKLEIKIADFGCSRMKQEGNNGAENLSLTKYIGTPLFSDPNIKGGKYSVKCDVYSAGLVITYIFCGKHFFSHCSSVEQLSVAKQKFTRDTVSSTMQFLQEFDDIEVSPRIKTFLVQISTFTMDDEEKNRHSAAELLEFINNQLANFQGQQNYSSKIQEPSQYESKPYQEVSGNGDMKKKKIKSEFISLQEEKSSSENVKMQKNNTSEQKSNRYHSLEKSDSEKSQMTTQTADESQKYQIQKQQSSYQNSQQDISYDQNSNQSFSNNDFTIGEPSFESPQREVQKNDESPNRFQNNQNSFISSDSNQFKNKWNKNKKAQGYSSRIFRNLKSSSSILETRTHGFNSKKLIEHQSLRQSRIDQKQKTLNETEKLCSQLIRYGAESSGINQEGEMMKTILATFNSIRKNFEMVKKIGEITQSPFTKQQKQTIAFMFHFIYAGKMKDLRSFVLGQPSNLKLGYSKISSKRRETICTIVQKELQRIFDNLKSYSNDLKRKVELIKPRLSDLTRNCIDDAFRCTSPADWLMIAYKQNEIKQETRKFIQEKKITTKNEQELEILNELSRAIGRMCQ